MDCPRICGERRANTICMDKDAYKHTIEEAADVLDAHADQNAKRVDAEIAYETLAVDSSMGMFGMQEQTANLIQLQLASEMLYKNLHRDDGND